MRSGGPRQATLDNTQYSLCYGTVTQNKDPDKKGRVKVSLPHLDNGDTDQTGWCQIVKPMVGKDYGWYTMPDVGDQVVVAFINGDIHVPVVLGGAHSTPDFCPETNEDGKNNFRGFRSRSGHRMILDDSSKVKVVIADKTGKNTIGVGQFDKDGAGPNVCAVFKPPMSGDFGVSISTVADGGKIIITAKETLSFTAEQAIKINITETFAIKAGKDIAFEGKTNTTLTSADETSYDGSTMAVL